MRKDGMKEMVEKNDHISDSEHKVLSFCEKYSIPLFLTVGAILRLYIFIQTRNACSGDMLACLIPWFNEAKDLGGIKALGQGFGDYNIPYQFLICIMTYIPVDPLYQFKMLSTVFDYLLAYSCARMVSEISDKQSAFDFCSVFVLVLFIPITWINSSIWGQCDSIYTYFIVTGLRMMYKGRNRLGFMLFGIAFSFKLQTMFIFPFLLILYICKRNYTIRNFLYLFLTFYLMCLPGVLLGRGVFSPVTIYTNQVNSYKKMWVNFPSIWRIAGFDDYGAYATPAVCLTIIILGFTVLWLLKQEGFFEDKRTVLALIVWTGLTCVIFLPSIHERYSYPFEMLLLVLAYIERRYRIVAVIEIFSVLLRYAYFLNHGVNPLEWYHAAIYFVAYIFFTYYLFGKKSDMQFKTVNL